MESDVGRYERLFAHIGKLRAKLDACGRRFVLDSYLNYVLESRELDYGMRLDDVVLEASHDLLHKCVAIVRGYKLGNDTWFTRMARAYIKAHPLDFAETTNCLVYSWMLFPYFFRFLLEDHEADRVNRVLYGRQYRALCSLVGKKAVDRLIKLLDEALLLCSARNVELRAGYDQMMALLTVRLEDSNRRLWELLLDCPELLDYQWLRAYQEKENETEQGE